MYTYIYIHHDICICYKNHHPALCFGPQLFGPLGPFSLCQVDDMADKILEKIRRGREFLHGVAGRVALAMYLTTYILTTLSFFCVELLFVLFI